MTTLRRVLQQTAKEAGPSTLERQSSVGSTVRPTTPGKARRLSSLHSTSDDGSDDETRTKASSGKRARISRGWDNASGASGHDDAKSSKSDLPKSPRASRDTATVGQRRKSSADSHAASLEDKRNRVEDHVERKNENDMEVDDGSTELVRDSKKRDSHGSGSVKLNADIPPAVSAPEPVKKHKEVDTSIQKGVERTQSDRSVSENGDLEAAGLKRPLRQASPIEHKEPPKHNRLQGGSKPEKVENRSTRPSMSSEPQVSSRPVSGIIEQEWVMCEDCKKWRKLPLNISASSLPERWFCHMNTWNAALASCSAPVEEGSEETPEAGLNETLQHAKKNYALPPGINLYGGQIQALTAAYGGTKQTRPATYRELIGVHYRANKPFIATYTAVCDARYSGFCTYVSSTIKPRAFDDPNGLLAFNRLGWEPKVEQNPSIVAIPLKMQWKSKNSSCNSAASN